MSHELIVHIITLIVFMLGVPAAWYGLVYAALFLGRDEMIR